MLVLGLLLIAVGALAIVAVLFTADGTAELLGTDVSAVTLFLIGVATGLAILLGLALSRLGARRSLRQRRENRRLTRLSEKFEDLEPGRRREPDAGQGSSPPGP